MGDLSVNDEADGDGEGGRRRTDPYYLRLTMGRPVGRPMSRSTPTMAYGLQVVSELLERLLFIFQLKITHLLVKVDHQQKKVEEKRQTGKKYFTKKKLNKFARRDFNLYDVLCMMFYVIYFLK